MKVAGVVVAGLVASSACTRPNYIECTPGDNAACDYDPSAVCAANPATGNGWCALPDSTCASGFRWDDVAVGDDVSGECVGGDADAPPNGPDAPPNADAQTVSCPTPTGSWSAPIKLTGPSTAESESGPALSSSGLELFFYAPRNDEFAFSDVFVTKRTVVTDPWGTARNTIFEIDTAANAESDPFISSDGFELFFSRAGFVYESRRSSPAMAWSQPEFTELTGSSPMLLQDGLTIYWDDPDATCPTDLCRMRATREKTTSA